MFNVLGDPIDEKEAPKAKEYHPIHKKAPEFTNLSTKAELYET
jgi:F-type H+-transporting ATPase subunit beta